MAKVLHCSEDALGYAYLAAEHHTAEQYSKPAGQSSKKISDGATDREIPARRLSHDTKTLSCSTGNNAKVLLKGYLSIKRYPQYNKVNPLLQHSSIYSQWG